MNSIKCPFCNVSQKNHWIAKTWEYSSTIVNRCECECGKDFNHYQGKKSSWTIPKSLQKLEN